MYNVILENENGEQLDLMHEQDMMCVHIDGVNSITATLNETENANIDGSTINSKRIDSRPINLTVRIFNNCGECRIKLYQHAVIKKKVKLTLVNDVRSVYIEGQVKSIDGDTFTKAEQMIITILCPEPYFNEIMAIEKEFSDILKMLYFPLAIEEDGIPFGEITDMEQVEVVNVGEVDTGIEFILKATNNVVNPRIIDMLTGEYIALNYTINAGEIIYISTIEKNKRIISRLQNEETNIIGHLDLSSTWLKAKVGVSNYTYSAESGVKNLEVSVKYLNKYLGI